MVNLLHPTFGSKWLKRHRVAFAAVCILLTFAIGVWMIANGDAIHARWGWGSLY